MFMRIYIAHPTEVDYQKEIYEPLKNDEFFSDYELVLPHEETVGINNARDDYKNIDLVIAECSQPSTGVGIELGWFYDDQKPIYCFVKSDSTPSNAVVSIAKEVISYDDVRDFVEKVKSIIINKKEV